MVQKKKLALICLEGFGRVIGRFRKGQIVGLSIYPVPDTGEAEIIATIVHLGRVVNPQYTKIVREYSRLQINRPRCPNQKKSIGLGLQKIGGQGKKSRIKS